MYKAMSAYFTMKLADFLVIQVTDNIDFESPIEILEKILIEVVKKTFDLYDDKTC